MRTYLATGQCSFTISVVCGIFVSFSISPHGGLCGLTCNNPSPVAPLQELVHRSRVVFEGKLQEEGRKRDINRREREKLLNQRAGGIRNESAVQRMEGQVYLSSESVPNRTSGSEPYQVRIRVHQVWEVKAGGLVKDSVVSIVWNRGDNCLTLTKDTRYMFFMEPTNDTSVFHAVFPPVETRRAVRKDVSKVLCQECAEPKLKEMKSVEVVEGMKTFLKCELGAGNPSPKLKWYKEGVEIGGGKNKLKDTKLKRKKEGKVSELHFKKTTDAHAGSYTCEAINNLGKTSTVGNVTLLRAATSTTPAAKTSSHMTACSDSEKNYCVNGGDCFTLEVTPGSTKFLCRCITGYTGNRCQATVPVRVINTKQAEELYQKRVLTITGICIALLVVGIMCVVAYCKTKKQRKKLHDRLRQSLRNERNTRASMANGPQINNTPLENVQLVNQFVSKNALPAQHVIEKETETSFSTNQYTSSAHQSTTVTHTSSQSWSNGRSESALSDSRSVLVMSSGENSRQATPSHRGRLNATGGARDLSAYLKNSGDTPDSYRDSPYSERYVSAMTTPTHLSPVELLSPVTPGSPPSEMSAPLSSLASVPSVAVSPSGEEERPLLFTTPPRPDHQSKRNSAHYNHGHEAHSPPPSPLRIVEDDDYETTQEYEAVGAAAPVTPIPPQSLPKKLAKNSNGRRAKRTKPNGHATGHKMESNDLGSSTESEMEEEEEERVGEDTPFLSLQNPMATGVEPLADGSRTNLALRLSPQDNLQARLSSVISKQDPVAV
ncbi:pro-neuregulin-1, membrane-bound isoform isoform X2 [Coregonus clupeaformis]|uniref:pro-neuregulin-1, membrane-bound isoform isoform X2 n=1 Tax=Coregonus clupeaformis TaxID=59861 RepID=UPI001E1C31DE|nr:pro-neuregulin-1, membrane-bound isoform isoform X2 [Coregonus clupeaformis]